MISRITQDEAQPAASQQRKPQPQPIGEILAELLAQYERRFPDLHITVVETPVAAV